MQALREYKNEPEPEPAKTCSRRMTEPSTSRLALLAPPRSTRFK
jgi:hypothetical protein